MLNCELDQSVSAVEVELNANVGSMILNRAHADAQLARNLFVGFVLGKQGKKADLGRGKVAYTGPLLIEGGSPSDSIQQMGRKNWTDVILAGGNRINAVDDVGGRVVLD